MENASALPVDASLLRIYRCTVSEQLVRQNLEFCQQFMQQQLLRRDMHTKIPVLAVSCVLFALGLVGNTLVVLSVALFPAMRSRTNLFLLNLAISDVLIFAICLPLTAYNIVTSRWVFGRLLCKLTPFLQGLSVSVSIYSLASMSAKRYILIRFPLRAKAAMSPRAMGWWLAGIWAVSALLCSPTPLAHALKPQRMFWLLTVHSCVEDWQEAPSKKLAYTLFLFAALYLAPLAAMTVFYSMLGRRLVSKAAELGANDEGARAIRRGRRRASRMLMALLLCFAVCWLPYHAVSAGIDLRFSAAAANRTDQPHGDFFAVVQPMTLLLGYANSAINPLCLYFMSSKFRKYFRLLLACSCRDPESARARSERANCSRQLLRERPQAPALPPAAARRHLPATAAAAAAAPAVDDETCC